MTLEASCHSPTGYQQTRLDQAKQALAASLADEDNPRTYAKHPGAVEVELADMIRLVDQLTGNNAASLPFAVPDGRASPRGGGCFLITACPGSGARE